MSEDNKMRFTLPFVSPPTLRDELQNIRRCVNGVTREVEQTSRSLGHVNLNTYEMNKHLVGLAQSIGETNKLLERLAVRAEVIGFILLLLFGACVYPWLNRGDFYGKCIRGGGRFVEGAIAVLDTCNGGTPTFK